MDIADIRTDLLNPDLGLTDDTATEPWGDETVRDRAIITAVERLWPTMARLVREDLAIVTDADEYELDEIFDLETIEVRDDTGRVYKEIRNFRSWVNDSADPAVSVVSLPVYWPAGTVDTLKAVGYAPFTVTGAAGAEATDVPARHAHILVDGARAYLYRRRFNQWIDFEQHQVQNRDNATSPSELFAMYQDAERIFQRAISENGRRMALPKVSRLRRG